MAAPPPAPTDLIIPESPSDTVSSLHFAPSTASATSDLLCASSWDNHVSVWEVAGTGECVPRLRVAQPAPVLGTAWSSDRSRIALGGCEQVVKVWNIQTNQQSNIGQHAAPIKAVLDLSAMAAQQNAQQLPSIVTGSWDNTVKYWDPRSPAANGAAALSVAVPNKVYAMDQKGFVLAVATAERHVLIFDLRKPDTVFRSMHSILKFQTRCIALFPNSEGFCIGSVEGRVGVQQILETAPAAASFAYKCHRQVTVTKEEIPFAVNAITFHPRYGTYATVGGDGVFSFWDKDAKQRLKLFTAQKNSIVAAEFNPSGTILAYSLGYDWSEGIDKSQAKKTPNHIALHKVVDADIQRKAAQPAQ